MKIWTREIYPHWLKKQNPSNLLSGKWAPTRARSRWIFFINKNKNNVKLSVNLKIFAFYEGNVEQMGQQIFFLWASLKKNEK